jgi:hypothetical protein
MPASERRRAIARETLRYDREDSGLEVRRPPQPDKKVPRYTLFASGSFLERIKSRSHKTTFADSPPDALF